MSSGAGRTLGIVGIGLIGGFAAGAMFGTMLGPMAFGLGYMGGSFLGQMIFPTKPQNAMPSAGSYPIQSAMKGQAIPVTYGTVRLAGNVIWLGPRTEYTIEQGGKSGGGSGTSEQTFYRRSFCIALCEGERQVIKIWEGKHAIYIGAGYSKGGKTVVPPLLLRQLDALGNLITGGGKADAAYEQYKQEITIFSGDGYDHGLKELIGEDYCNYKDLCCVFFDSWDLGAADCLPNFTFEVTQSIPLGAIIGSFGGHSFRLDNGYEITKAIDTSDGKSVDYNALVGKYVVSATPSPIFDDGEPAFVFNSADDSQVVLHFPAPTGSWGSSQLTFGVRFTADGQYLYVYTVEPEYLIKYSLVDGSIVWYKNLDVGDWVASPAYSMEVDSFDNVYVGNVYYPTMLDGTHVMRFTPGGDLDVTWRVNGCCRDMCVEETGLSPSEPTGRMMVCSQDYSGWPTTHYQAYLLDLDGTVIKEIDFGHKAINDESWSAICIDHYWYVWTNSMGPNNYRLWKLDWDGNIISGIPTPPGYTAWIHLWEVPHGMIGIHGSMVGYPATVWIYNTDLELVSTYNCDNSDFPLSSFNTYWGNEAVFMYGGHGEDANPADILWDMLTNSRYGINMPASRLDPVSWAAVHQYCEENDLLISVEISTAKAVLDWIQYVCAHFGGFLYWMGGKLYLGAWRAEDPEVHITRDDLVAEGDAPPVQVKKRKYSESRNLIEIVWQNRDDSYGPASTPAKDDVDIRVSGKIRKEQMDLAGIKRASLAAKMAHRYLIDSMYRFSFYTFSLSFKKCLLHVGQVCLLTDGFKITNQRIRIVSIGETKDGKSLAVEAVDDISNLYPDLTSMQSEVTARTPETYIVASDLAEPIVTIREDWKTNTLHLSLAPTNAYVTGWQIFGSRDGATYEYLETVMVSGITGGSANSAGTITTGLDSAMAPTWRGNESVTVNIGTVTDLHTDITDSQFFGNERLAMIGSEIVAYRTCEETAVTGVWKITGLIRGLFQTNPVAHVVGEIFRTLDINYSWDFQASDIGRTLYIKAITTYGGSAMSVSDADATPVTVMGNYARPYGAALVRLTPNEIDGGSEKYSGAGVTAYWNLCSKTSGFNIGPQDGGGTWKYGDSESELVAHSGGPWGHYHPDSDLQAIDLVMRQENGTFIGQKSIAVGSSQALFKATDLGGYNPARIEVWPRYTLRATREESITVNDGT